MIIWPGKQIDQPSDERNCLSKEYTAELVAVCNAILNLKFKGGAKITISDKGMLIDLDNLLNGTASSTSSADHPWKITLQDTADGRTFRVGDGAATYLTRPGFSYSSLPGITSSGTGVDITVPAGTSYAVWAEISTHTAIVAYGEGASIPANWNTYPQTQGIDPDWPGYGSYDGYFLIGYVDANSSPTVVTQILTHNPQIPCAGPEEVIYQGTWSSGSKYRLNAIVRHSGATYIRAGTALGGDDGGTPGASADWQIIS